MASENKKIAKIVIDRGLCIGAASCVVAADKVFELDGENKSVIKLKDRKKSSRHSTRKDLEDDAVTDEALLEAARSCPTKAISLYDENGEQIYP